MSTAKKPNKAPPAKKTKLAEKSHEEPKVDSSDESSVAQTKKVTPPKKRLVENRLLSRSQARH